MAAGSRSPFAAGAWPCARALSRAVPAGSRDSSPVMRSSSTLPVPQPSSAPPTPTRLSGPNSDTEEEERGDLIQFYNSVYIEQIKDFALKYTSNAVSHILCFFLINTALSSDHAVEFPYIKKILVWLNNTTKLAFVVHCVVPPVWKSLAAASPELGLQLSLFSLSRQTPPRSRRTRSCASAPPAECSSPSTTPCTSRRTETSLPSLPKRKYSTTSAAAPQR